MSERPPVTCEWCSTSTKLKAENARLREAMLHTLNALQSVNNAGQAQDILRQALDPSKEQGK